MPALTAWLAMEKLPVQPREKLLIAGAGGAVGNYVVQLAVLRGFEVVAMSHQRHWQRLQTLGARQCVIDAPESVPQQHFFAVIDMVNEAHAAALAPALRANGHLVCIQGRTENWPNRPFGRALSMHEVALGALHVHGDDDDWRALTAAGEDLLRHVADGRLKAEPAIIGEFAELPQRLDALRHRQFSGKPLIRVTPIV